MTAKNLTLFALSLAFVSASSSAQAAEEAQPFATTCKYVRTAPGCTGDLTLKSLELQVNQYGSFTLHEELDACFNRRVTDVIGSAKVIEQSSNKPRQIVELKDGTVADENGLSQGTLIRRLRVDLESGKGVLKVRGGHRAIELECQ